MTRNDALQARTADRWMLALAVLLPMTIVHSCASESGDETPALECVTDDDCGLVPAFVSCCQECEPAPPFEAVPRSRLDAVWLDLETRCAESGSLCELVPCPFVPTSCVATAMCLHGRCTVVQEGCDQRLAATGG